MNISVDERAFKNSFEKYSKIGDTGNGGLNRLALSDADVMARDELIKDLTAIETKVRVDELGNIWGRYPGENNDAPPIVIGSHLDSQPFGGRFDGQLGVLTSLETLRTFHNNDIILSRPIDLVNWTGEEGSRFDLGALGSATFGGRYSVKRALSSMDENGVTVGEALEGANYAGNVPCEAFKIHAYLELHIEQGPVLNQSRERIGIVDGIYGASWFDAKIIGMPNHAGTTPMDKRKDALTAATRALQQINKIPLHLDPESVLTVGKIAVEPGSINVIPGEATFTVDVRSYKEGVIDKVWEVIDSELNKSAAQIDGNYALKKRRNAERVEFSSNIKESIKCGAETVGIGTQNIISGAGHDARYLCNITDAGMIFVPSVNGISHNEAEFTEWSDCVDGANVFANTVYELDSD